MPKKSLLRKITFGEAKKVRLAINNLVIGRWPPTLDVHGGDMASTWVAKLRVHAEGQITS